MRFFHALVPFCILASAFADTAGAVPLDGSEAPIEVAQAYGLRPPGSIGSEEPYRTVQQDDDAAGLLVRIDRLENQMRQITGQLEQMQFANRRLEDQLKKFQQDVEFRFQESGRGKPALKRGDATDGVPSTNQTAILAPETGGSITTPGSSTPARPRRSDAFDPATEPAAPGAPRTLGTLAPSGTAMASTGIGQPDMVKPPQIPSGPIVLDDTDPNAPLDLSGSRFRGTAAPPTSAPQPAPLSNAVGTAAPSSRAAAQSPTVATTPGGTVIAALPANVPKEEFDVALGYFKDRQYENAEKGFASFLQKNAKNRLAPDALYYLGETYFQRGRQREAAEQYLKISTEHASSARAPEAMLRLGQSLNALGAKEQACATFNEVARKYPNASASIKSGAEREAKRTQC